MKGGGMKKDDSAIAFKDVNMKSKSLPGGLSFGVLTQRQKNRKQPF
jgi:hypothetical protein